MRLNRKQFPPMYHGSTVEFNKGDIVTPMDLSFVSATSSKDFASEYGHPYRVSPVDWDDVDTYPADKFDDFHGTWEPGEAPDIHESESGFIVLEGHPNKRKRKK